MKKIYLAFAFSVLLTGCSVFRQPAVLVSSGLDYSEYTKQGFFLSESNSVSFTYEPIASVSSLQLSGYKIKDSGVKKFNDDTYQTSVQSAFITTTNEYIQATESEVLKKLVSEAKAKGANGIINLEIKSLTNVSREGVVLIIGYNAKGMAIKK